MCGRQGRVAEPVSRPRPWGGLGPLGPSGFRVRRSGTKCCYYFWMIGGAIVGNGELIGHVA
jgi:hypothetical protein